MSNEYAIVPEEEFSKLKTEVQSVKNNPLGSSEDGKNMVETLKQLNQSMTGLVNLFNTATDELKMEEHDSALISEKIGPLFEKIDNLEKQNEKIAKGIVAVADMLKEFREEYDKDIDVIKSRKDIDSELNFAAKKKGSDLNMPAPHPEPQHMNNPSNDFNMENPPGISNNMGFNNNPIPSNNPPGMGEINKPLPMSDSNGMPPDMGLPNKPEKKKGLFHF